MTKKNYLQDIEDFLEEKRNPVELLNAIFKFLNFKPVEIKIYNLLLKTSMTIKQIEHSLNVSERTIRKYIKRLGQEGFIVKKVEEGDRLRYIYRAVPVQEVWEKVKQKIENILEEITKSIETASAVAVDS